MTAPRRAALLGLHTRAELSNHLPKAQPATAAETPGVPIKRTNGSTPRAWKINGLHKSKDSTVPAASNPTAADAWPSSQDCGYLMRGFVLLTPKAAPSAF